MNKYPAGLKKYFAALNKPCEKKTMFTIILIKCAYKLYIKSY